MSETRDKVVNIVIRLYEDADCIQIPEDWLLQLVEFEKEQAKTIKNYKHYHSELPDFSKVEYRLCWQELMAFVKTVAMLDWLKCAVGKAISEKSVFEEGGIKLDRKWRSRLTSLANWYPVSLGRPIKMLGGIESYHCDQYLTGALKSAIVQLASGADIQSVAKNNIWQTLKNYDLKIDQEGNHE